MIEMVLVCLSAVALDRFFGEPPRWHPLVGFGRLAQWVETGCYGGADTRPEVRRIRGILALLLLLAPALALTQLLSSIPYLGFLVSVGLLYLALGATSLAEHATAVGEALKTGDLDEARNQVARIVSRDTDTMSEEDIALATVESVLENGCDAVFGALLWFLVAGAPGVVVYRLVNTLDAMWGYPTPRYLHFGWAAARLDDLLNWPPARLTALSYALLGDRKLAWQCWQTQGRAWKSPNAGAVMAAGAGALHLQLGGPARYFGETIQRPPLGVGLLPRGHDIDRALSLVYRTLGLWLALVTFVGVASFLIGV
jgi:adenosylcobinamide-phosphate synthase